MNLPYFVYRPNPVKTGSIVESAGTCECCSEQRGFMYQGPIYSKQVLANICPWCIASGEAVSKFAATFNACGMFADKDPVDAELGLRTPGFSSFQEADWLFHCDDGCEFHGQATVGDLKKISQEETERLFATSSLDPTELDHMKEGNDETELHYLFKFVCRHCGHLMFLEDLD